MKPLYDRISNILRNERYLLVLYGIGSAFLLLPMAHGAGMFWDWSFPYFQHQITNFFNYRSASWNWIGYGAPLGYTSDYILRFLISLYQFLPPETLLYGIYVLIFTMESFFVY